MTHVNTLDNLKAELSFIKGNPRVHCRPLFQEGECYGYQLFFIANGEIVDRIFIHSKTKEVSSDK